MNRLWRKRVLCALVVALAVAGPWVSSQGLTAQKPVSPSASQEVEGKPEGVEETAQVPTPALSPVEGLALLWEERRKALAAGDTVAGDALLKSLLEARLDSGMNSAEAFSAALIQEGLAAIERDEYEMGFQRLQMARELSPDYPSAYYATGKAYWRQHWAHALKALDEYLTGFRVSIGNFWWGFYRTGDLILILALGLLVGFLAFAVALLFRYFPLLVHTVGERVPVPEVLIGTGFLVLWAIPVALNLGVFWSLTLVFTSLWFFMAFRERVVVAGFLVVMALLPFWLRAATVFLVAPELPYLQALAQVRQGTAHGEMLKALEARVESESPAKLALFALGLQAKRTGDFPKAMVWYPRYLEIDPVAARGHVNLGNVYLAQDQPQQAISAYIRALELDPQQVEAQYNLSQVYREEFLFDEGERAYQAAKALDPEAVNRFRRWSGEHYNRRVVDVNLSVGDLRKVAFHEAPFSATPAWVSPMAGIPNGWLPGVALVLAVGLIGSLRVLQNRSLHPAFACRKCGRVVCGRCQRNARNNMCTQCLHALVVMEGVGPTERVRKLLEIERYQGRKRLYIQILSILYPGSGHVFGGATVPGGVALMAASLWVVAWAVGWGPMVPPTQLFQGGGTVLFLLGLLGIYALVLRDVLQRFR